MKEKERNTILAAVYGAEEIAKLCVEINFNLSRLSEFTEDERIIKILEELPEKQRKYPEIALPLPLYAEQ